MNKKGKNKKKVQIQKEFDELQNKYLRLLADYDNLVKRSDEERKTVESRVKGELIRKLLPALDSLEEAQKHFQDEGLDLTVKRFQDILEEEGLEKIETYDQEFNPEEMECVETAESEKNRVVDEVEKGYKIDGRILRVAKVKVGE